MFDYLNYMFASEEFPNQVLKKVLVTLVVFMRIIHF